MIKTVFYDLDGTLLPMDMDKFMKAYFGAIAMKMGPLGYDKEKLIAAIWAGTRVMVKNDGSRTNEEAFWDYFCKEMNIDIDKKEVFEDFYRNEFDSVQASCGYNEEVPKLIKTVREMGLKQVLATNPIFPSIATEKRMAWAGLSISDFETVTTYENSHYSKPNPMYYEELLNKLNLKAEETLMIGNDAVEDVAAMKTGMKVFIVTDCLLNPTNEDISSIPQGNFSDALAYIRKLLEE